MVELPRTGAVITGLRWPPDNDNGESSPVELTVSLYALSNHKYRMHLGTMRRIPHTPLQSLAEQVDSDQEPSNQSYVERPSLTIVGSTRGEVRDGCVFLTWEDSVENFIVLWDAAGDGYAKYDGVGLWATVSVVR